jgi:hypothetical protein
MATKKKSSRQRFWTNGEVRQLRALSRQKLPAAAVARRLKRSIDSTKKKASNLGIPLGAIERWTPADLRRLKSLARTKRPVGDIARALKRTEAATEKMASNFGVSLDFRG